MILWNDCFFPFTFLCVYFVLIDINRNYSSVSGKDYARTLLAKLYSWSSCWKPCCKLNPDHPSWVVDQDISVHEWNCNGKRAWQKCHFSIPVLDTLQVASGPVIPKEAFIWPQVAQHLIQKGKKRIKSVGTWKATSSFVADATSCCIMLGTQLVWESCCALCNPANLVPAAPSWYSQLFFWLIVYISSYISRRDLFYYQHKRSLWFGSHKSSISAVFSVKALVEIAVSNMNLYFQYCKMQKDIVIIIPQHILFCVSFLVEKKFIFKDIVPFHNQIISMWKGDKILFHYCVICHNVW